MQLCLNFIFYPKLQQFSYILFSLFLFQKYEMGALLDKPKTDKYNEHGDWNGLRFGLASMQGWRIEMEDAHCKSFFKVLQTTNKQLAWQPIRAQQTNNL